MLPSLFSRSAISATRQRAQKPDPLRRRSRGLTSTPFTRTTNTVAERPVAKSTASPISWHHHGWSQQVLEGVVPGHRKPRTAGDWVAWRLVRFCRYGVSAAYDKPPANFANCVRFGMDLATGMRVKQRMNKSDVPANVQKHLTEAQWVS